LGTSKKGGYIMIDVTTNIPESVKECLQELEENQVWLEDQ